VEAVTSATGVSKTVSFSAEREGYGEYTVTIGSLSGSFAVMTQGQIIAARSYAAMNGMQTCKMDMSIVMMITDPTIGEIGLTANAHEDLDIANKEIYMYADMIMTLFGQEVEMSMEAYIFEDWMYSMVESEVLPQEENGKWYKQKTSQAELDSVWNDRDITGQQIALLGEVGAVEIIGTEKIRGIECYKVQVNLDIEALEAYLKTQLGFEDVFPPGY